MRLTDFAAAHGKTRAELAAALGVSVGTFYGVQRIGLRPADAAPTYGRPPLVTSGTIAAALGVAVAEVETALADLVALWRKSAPPALKSDRLGVALEARREAARARAMRKMLDDVGKGTMRRARAGSVRRACARLGLGTGADLARTAGVGQTTAGNWLRWGIRAAAEGPPQGMTAELIEQRIGAAPGSIVAEPLWVLKRAFPDAPVVTGDAMKAEMQALGGTVKLWRPGTDDAWGCQAAGRVIAVAEPAPWWAIWYALVALASEGQTGADDALMRLGGGP